MYIFKPGVKTTITKACDVFVENLSLHKMTLQMGTALRKATAAMTIIFMTKGALLLRDVMNTTLLSFLESQKFFEKS